MKGQTMRRYRKRDVPVDAVRSYLEPGPVVLVSSWHKEKCNIMTMGWHMMMSEEPSLVGCFVWDKDYSRKLIRQSKECVINVPTADMIRAVIGIGNSHGEGIDKFEKFGLTPVKGSLVKAPLIEECFANFECKLVDTSLIERYSVFVFEVVKGHVAISPRWPTTIHYRGDGIFMIAGRNVSYKRLFKPENL